LVTEPTVVFSVTVQLIKFIFRYRIPLAPLLMVPPLTTVITVFLLHFQFMPLRVVYSLPDRTYKAEPPVLLASLLTNEQFSNRIVLGTEAVPAAQLLRYTAPALSALLLEKTQFLNDVPAVFVPLILIAAPVIETPVPPVAIFESKITFSAIIFPFVILIAPPDGLLAVKSEITFAFANFKFVSVTVILDNI